MKWTLILLETADAQLSNLDNTYRPTADELLRLIEQNPFGAHSKKLKGLDSHRGRKGRVRIQYFLDGKYIVIVAVGLRDEKTYK